MKLDFNKKMILRNIMAGGFNMIYINDVISKYSDSEKRFLSYMIAKKYLYIEYAGRKNYGFGLYSFTKKGVEFYKNYVKNN